MKMICSTPVCIYIYIKIYKNIYIYIYKYIYITIKKSLLRVKLREDISSDTLEYFFINNPKLGRFYLLPKIHKRLHNVPGRPVISNFGYFTENISAFVDYHLQPL